MSHTNLKGQAYWQEQIRLFEMSKSNNKAAFCKKHKLNYHQFLYWQSKSQRKTIQPKLLVPVAVSEPSGLKAQHISNSALCSIVLNGGHQINVYDVSVLPALKSLIEVV